MTPPRTVTRPRVRPPVAVVAVMSAALTGIAPAPLLGAPARPDARAADGAGVSPGSAGPRSTGPARRDRRTPRATGPRGAAPRPGAPDSRADAPAASYVRDGVARVTAAPVSLAGAAGSLQVIAIPVPAALRDAATLGFRVSAVGRSRVLGQTVGLLPAAGRPGTLLVTVSAPANALAGGQAVAVAEFDGGAGPVIAVPVEMRVAATRRIEAAVVDRLVAGAAGAEVRVRYRVMNLGNQPDTVRVDAVLPAGWRVLAAEEHARLVLGVRGAHEGTLRLWIPPQPGVSTATVRVTVAAGGERFVAGDVQVEVRDPRTAPRGVGPSLTLGAVAAAVPNGPAVTAYTAALDGTVSDSVTVSARGTFLPGGAGGSVAGMALARTGVADVAPTLSVASPHLRATAGLTGGTLTDLTGLAISGVGGSLGVSEGAWTASGFAARPASFGFGGASDRGTLAGAKLERDAGTAHVYVAASRLTSEAWHSELDAVSAGAAGHSATFGDLTSELAYRRYAAGQGLGWAASMRRQSASGSLDARVLHAPGGGRAFAQGTDQFALSGSRRVASWLSTGGSYWRTGDDNASVGALHSNGWAFGPTLSLPRGGASLALEARGSSFGASGAYGAMGERETQLAALLDVRRGPVYFTTNATTGRIERTTAADGAALPAAAGNRFDGRSALGVALAGGTVEATAALQRTSGAAAFFPEQRAVGLRADRIPLAFTGRLRATAGAELQYLSFGPSQTAVRTERLSLTAPVGFGMGVSVGAERNPFLLGNTGAGRGGWLTTLRIERSMFLPRAASHGARRLYRNLDGDGRREGNEPGVAAAVVSCAGRSVVTDREGRFDCPRDAEVLVDPRALPAGWMAPGVVSGRQQPAELGVLPMSTVRVRVVLEHVDTLRVPREQLRQLLVVARDAAGQPWVGRVTGPGEAVFDALPPGRYAVQVDASAIDEPLQLVGEPTLTVAGGSASGGRDVAPLTVTLRGRPVKVRVLSPATTAAVPAVPAVGSSPSPASGDGR